MVPKLIFQTNLVLKLVFGAEVTSVPKLLLPKSALFRATHVMNSAFGGERQSKFNKYMQDIGDIY